MATDIEAVVYLMLMNQMLHDLFPTCITIGEDVSGMPTFARFVTSAQWLSPPLLGLDPSRPPSAHHEQAQEAAQLLIIVC